MPDIVNEEGPSRMVVYEFEYDMGWRTAFLIGLINIASLVITAGLLWTFWMLATEWWT